MTTIRYFTPLAAFNKWLNIHGGRWELLIYLFSTYSIYCLFWYWLNPPESFPRPPGGLSIVVGCYLLLISRESPTILFHQQDIRWRVRNFGKYVLLPGSLISVGLGGWVLYRWSSFPVALGMWIFLAGFTGFILHLPYEGKEQKVVAMTGMLSLWAWLVGVVLKMWATPPEYLFKNILFDSIGFLLLLMTVGVILWDLRQRRQGQMLFSD